MKQLSSWAVAFGFVLFLAGCGKPVVISSADTATVSEGDAAALQKEVTTMFMGSWTDRYENPKLTLDFHDRGLQVQERGFDERWIRVNWKDPKDVGRWLKLKDDETLIFTDEHADVELKPWKYWRKINVLNN